MNFDIKIGRAALEQFCLQR